MIRIALIATVLLSPFAASADLEGTWTAHARSHGKTQLRLTIDDRWTSSFPIATSTLRGLSADTMSAPSRSPVDFALQREAGTFSFNGSFKEGAGAGFFRFVGDRAFEERLRNAGARMERKKTGASDEKNLLSLALFDVSTAFVRELQALGLDDLSIDDLTSLRIHGATTEYIRDLHALGYRDLDADDIVSFRIHGVTTDFIREMTEFGYRLSGDDLVAMRIHGVTPELVRELKEMGYERVDGDDLVALRIHGAKPDFIRALRELGYDRVPIDKLIAMRIHGVTPEFIRSIQSAGLKDVPVDKLIEMRIHGIDADYVSAFTGTKKR